MVDAVRLIIWDLDETFWRGTLTEGGIEFLPENKRILIELARRGIVSSICSKNSFESAKEILVDNSVWDYFVLPSISWEPKGPRIQALIETIGLRPSTVMFIDDNTLNLEEARRFTPDLQVKTHEFISDILADPLFRGKDDQELTRLKQYKVLEQRKVDQGAAGDNIHEFLKESNIRVLLDYDVDKHVDRFIELINRTNQLNFTKRRLSEDLEKARAEARELMTSYARQMALVRVRDRYGDHGYCGAYVHNSEERNLEHFAFSCRMLGMGVERWLYAKLNKPGIRVRGEVLANLFDPTPIDWITLETTEQSAASDGDVCRLDRVTARGSCDIGAVVHYFRQYCDDTVGEYHIFRNGGTFRIDHSVFLKYGAEPLTRAQLEAAKCFGFIESDFQTRIYDMKPNANKQMVLLSFGADAAESLYRHRQTGLLIPFGVHVPNWPRNRSLARITDNELPKDYPEWASVALENLRANWDFVGRIAPADFEANLRLAASRIPETVDVYILNFFDRRFMNSQGATAPEAADLTAFNDAITAVAESNSNIKVIDVNAVITNDEEIRDRLHFERLALFRIYQSICQRLFPPALTAVYGK